MVYPYQLSEREMEARLPAGLALLPGQLVRFEREQPVYGQIVQVRALSEALDASHGCLVTIRLLYGRPDLTTQTATLLTEDEMPREVQRLQEPCENPLHLGEALTGEFFHLGPLTLIEGQDFILKYDALMLLVEAVEPYQRMLIIDPLGIFSPVDRLGYFRAGEEVRLSLEAVGSKRFLDAFSDLFPPGLRKQALQAVAEQVLPADEFVSLDRYLNLEIGTDIPLKSLVMQAYQEVQQAQVFANEPEQVFSLQKVLGGHHLSVMDLSALAEPWKSLFYEEICREIFRNAGGDVMPVLIYPAHYLQDLSSWIHKADEAELSLVILASPYSSEDIQDIANNVLVARSRERLQIQGDLTLGLPVSVPLPESTLVQPAPAVIEEEVGTQATVWSEPLEPEEPPDGVQLPEEIPLPKTETPLPPQEPPSPKLLDVVDLSAPPLEQILPAEVPESAASVHVAQEFPLPAEALAPQPEAEPISAPEPELSEPAPSLDYPDADEGAWTPTPPATPSPVPEPDLAGMVTSEPALPPNIELELPAFPGPDDLASDEFSFDVNLDRKPEEEWDLALEAEPAAVPSAVSESLSGFEDLDARPSPATEPAWADPEDAESVSAPWLPEEATGKAPSDEPSFASQPESDVEEAVPIHHKTAEQTGSEPAAAFRAGDHVRHEKYGLGIVNKVLPMEGSVILNITFESVGKRLLDPALTQLTKEAG